MPDETLSADAKSRAAEAQCYNNEDTQNIQ